MLMYVLMPVPIHKFTRGDTERARPRVTERTAPCAAASLARAAPYLHRPTCSTNPKPPTCLTPSAQLQTDGSSKPLHPVHPATPLANPCRLQSVLAGHVHVETSPWAQGVKPVSFFRKASCFNTRCVLRGTFTPHGVRTLLLWNLNLVQNNNAIKQTIL